MTQPEIVAQTQLSRGTVSTVIKTLRERHFVVRVDRDRSSVGPAGGRPAERLELRPDAANALCIDIGQRHVDVALGNLSGIGDSSSSAEMDVADDAPNVLKDAVERVHEVMERQTPRLTPRDLVGVCVGVPAAVDRHRDQLVSTRGLDSWAGIRPARELRRHLGPDWRETSFELQNDANLRAWAELAFGAASTYSNNPEYTALSLKWSEGIGGAVIAGNDVITGWRGLAGEIGHTVISEADPDTPPCPRCGHKCLEAHAGGHALMERVAPTRNGSSPEYFSDLIRRAVDEDGAERTLVREAAMRIGQALGPHISALNPRLVIIGGRPFADAKADLDAYRLIVDAVREGWRETGFPASVEDVDLLMSDRGSLTAALGGIVRTLRAGLSRHVEQRLIG